MVKMPTPYISRLKLEKELEKKARMIREKKLKCERYMENIEKFIEKLSGVIDISSFSPLLEEAKKYFERRDYDEALKKFELLEKEIKKSSKESYKNRLEKIEEILKNLKEEEISEIRGELKKAGEKIDEDPPESFRILESVEQRVEKIAEAEFETLKAVIIEKIGSLEGYQWVQNEIENIKEKGFESIEKLREIEEKAVREIRKNMEELISRADDLKKIASSAHYHFSVSEEERNNALKFFEEENYEEALSTAKEYYESTKKNFKDFFSKLLGISRMIVEEGKIMELDMSEQWKKLEKAEKYFQEEKFEKAIEVLRKATDEAENIKLQRVIGAIKEIRERFVEAKKRDIDIKPYLKMIENARNLLKIGRHKRAYDLVREAINMIDRKLNLYENLEKELRNLKEMMEELKKENIILEGIDERIGDIEELLEKDVEKAEKKIDELKGVIKINLRDIANALYNDLNELFRKSEKVGLEAPEIKSEIEKIEEMIEDASYKDAIVALREIEDEIYDTIYQFIDKKLQELERYEEKEIVEKGKEVKELLEKGEIKQALEKLNTLNNLAYKIEDKKYRKRLEEIEKEVEFLRKEGINVTEIKGYVERAKTELERRNISIVESYITKVNSLIKRIKTLKAIELYNSVKNLRESIKNMELDLEKSEAGDIVKELDSAMEKKDYEKVIKLAKNAKEKIKEFREKAMEARTMISGIQHEIEELKKEDVSLGDAEKELSAIKSLFKDGKFEDCLKRTKDLESKLKEIEKRACADRIKEKIEKLGDILKENRKFKEHKALVNKFLKSFGKEEWEKVISDGESILKRLSYEVEKILKEKIDTVEKDLEEFKSQGFYISAEREEVKNAKEEVFRGDYVNAYNRIKTVEEKLEDIRKREKKIREINESIRKKLNFASSLGMEIEEYEKKMSEIYSSKSSREMGRKAESLIGEIEAKLKEKIESLIENVEAQLDSMRKRGVDVTTSESLLSKAREELRSGEYKKSLKFVLDAMSEIENFEMQKTIALGILRRIEDKIKKMKTLLPREVIHGYQEAKSLFLKGDYQNSIEKSMEINEKLWDIERITERIKERNAEIKDIVVKAHRSGMDVKNVLRLFNRAKVEYQKLHYEEAYKLVEECYREAKKLIMKLMEKYKKVYVEILKLIKEAELEEYFKDVLDEIDEAFEKEDTDILKVKLSSLNEELKEKIEDKVKEMLEALHKKGEFATQLLGEEIIKLDKEEKKLEEMKDKSLVDFVKYYGQLIKKIEEDIVTGIKNKIEEFRKELEKYEKMGIEVNKYYEKIGDLLSKLTKENSVEIYGSFEELKKAFDSFAQEYLSSYVNNLVEKVGKYSKDKAQKFRERMEELIQSGKYEELPAVAKEVDEFIAEYKLNVQDLNRRVRELKDLLVQATKIGYDIREYAKELKEVLSNIKDIREAIKKVSEIEEEIRKSIEKLEPRLLFSLDIKGKVDSRYQAKINVRNEGDVDAFNVKLVVNGELKTEKPIEINVVKKGNEEIIDVFLLPGKGEEIEIKGEYERFDGKKYRSSERVKIELKKKGFHVEKNKNKVKCSFCRGTILPGMDIVICDNCGAVYHLPCARRAGKCVKCGTLFNFE